MNRERHLRDQDHTEKPLSEEQMCHEILSAYKNGHLSNFFVYVNIEKESLLQEAIETNNSVLTDVASRQDKVTRLLAKADALNRVLNLPDEVAKQLEKIQKQYQEESE